MQPLRQATKYGLIRVGGDIVDEQLTSCDTDGDRGAIVQEGLDAARDCFHRWFERGMASRVHRVSMERNRQLEEEVVDVAGESDALWPGCLHPNCLLSLLCVRARREALRQPAFPL